jgi:carbonic anhydrase
LVLGHTKCGAVDATIAGKPVPGKIGSILAQIQPAANATAKSKSTDRLKETTIVNVKNQINGLKSSPVLADLIKKGQLKIVGGVYDLDTGIVTPVV